MSQSHIDQLISDLRLKNIPAFRRGEREYETSAAAANLAFAYTRPGCVVQPENTEQVQYIIEQAKDVGENIIVKGGGHSYTGFSTTDRGVLLDLRRMTSVKLQLSKEDKNRKRKPETVKIQGGARWVDVYRTLINGGWNKYVVIGGRCPAVGVGGFILGGGLGPFTREFGLGSDSLIEATIVTADGQKIVVNDRDPADSEKGKLFWALRGAGSNAFGVVTEIRMKVMELKDFEVVAGKYEWAPSTTDEDWPKLIATMQKFYTAAWPNDMTIDSNWMLEVENEKSSTMKIRFSFYFNGSLNEFKQVIRANIDDEKLATEIIRRARPEPSTRFLHESLLLIWDEETRLFIPNNESNAYQKYSSFCFTNEGAQIAKILEAVKTLQAKFKTKVGQDKASFWVTFIHAGGEANKTELGGAYPWRKTVYNTYVTLKFKDKWVETIANEFLLEAKATLKEFSLDQNAAYINFSDSAIVKDWGKAYYGEHFEKVSKIRDFWNHDNYFDWPWAKQAYEIQEVRDWKRKNKIGDPNVIEAWDLTDLPGWSSWRDDTTPAPVGPISQETVV